MNLVTITKMTSMEISEVTGKEHKNILRDIKDEIEKLENGGISSALKFELREREGITGKIPYFELTKEGVLQLAARYDAVVRAKLIDLAMKQDKPQIPHTFKEALILLLQSEEEKEKLQLESKQKDQIISELQPKASYYDFVLQTKSAISMSQIAKDYGMSATKMNDLLHVLAVQYKQGDTWLLYQKHAQMGYTSSKTHNYVNSNDEQCSKLHTYWTQKGRLFIYDLLKSKKGLLPLIEREAVMV